MKKLKISTIKRELRKIGFLYNTMCKNAMTLHMNYPDGGTIHLEFSKNNLGFKTSGARWTEASNVHIEAYWHIPRSMKELDNIINKIIYTYTTLCSTKFIERGQNGHSVCNPRTCT